MSNTTQAACFCVGKISGCTCGGRCRCECTCQITEKDFQEFSAWCDLIRKKEDLEEKFESTQPPNCS